MAKVTGIGGIFIKASNNESLQNWYQENLGIQRSASGTAEFKWTEKETGADAFSIFHVFSKEDKYFDPSTSQFMINFRVDDLDGILDQLRKNGVKVFDEIQVESYGRFGWNEDPNGNKVELWEPTVG